MARIYNFSAGPAMMPEKVLERAAGELLDYSGSGMSVMEMSHRSKQFIAIADRTTELVREVMSVPENYKIIYLQGGATLQFAGIPMNLMSKTGKADYALTGMFSKKAADEAARFGKVNIAASSKDRDFAYIPQQTELKLDSEASYFHYCMNNTVYGSLWNYIPDTGNVPLVSDVSSCIMSEPLDVTKFGLLYAGAQKNLGPSGLTLVIIREDLAGNAPQNIPSWMDYSVQIKNDSMYNTPACYGIYMLGLTLDWIKEMGGLEGVKKNNIEKAKLLYDVLDNSKLYKMPVDKEYRSLMNVTFRTGDEALDEKFVKEAAAEKMTTLKGHRNVGGMRASIYNAMPIEGCKKLAEFMQRFEAANK